jgi:predicted enzyme related to lactoylglutathione lyase
MAAKAKAKKKPAPKAKKPAAKKAAAKKAPAKKAPAKKAEEPKHHAPRHGSIGHIEFVAPDINVAGAVYKELFGWQIFPFQPNEHYFQCSDTMGGCIIAGTPVEDGKTKFYVNVDSIEITIPHAERLGANLAQAKTEIPGGHGFFAHLRMPEGNTIGIWSMH